MPLKHRSDLFITVSSKAAPYPAHCKNFVWVILCVLQEYSHILMYLVKRKRAKKSILCSDSIADPLLSMPLSVDCTKILLSTQCSPFPVPACLV